MSGEGVRADVVTGAPVGSTPPAGPRGLQGDMAQLLGHSLLRTSYALY